MICVLFIAAWHESCDLFDRRSPAVFQVEAPLFQDWSIPHSLDVHVMSGVHVVFLAADFYSTRIYNPKIMKRSLGIQVFTNPYRTRALVWTPEFVAPGQAEKQPLSTCRKTAFERPVKLVEKLLTVTGHWPAPKCVNLNRQGAGALPFCFGPLTLRPLPQKRKVESSSPSNGS